jgi:hypothetical protein
MNTPPEHSPRGNSSQADTIQFFENPSAKRANGIAPTGAALHLLRRELLKI